MNKITNNNDMGNSVSSSCVDRRQFIGGAALATVSAVPYFGWQKLAFANNSQNDRPNIGSIYNKNIKS